MACEGDDLLQRGRGQLAVEPSALNFGAIAEGATDERSVVVTNAGTAVVGLTVSLDPSGSPDFTIRDTALSVPARAILSIDVRYAPSSSGSDESRLILTADDPSIPPVQVLLLGGPIAAELDVDPDPVDFAPAMSALESRTLTLRNRGQANLQIDALGIDMGGNQSFSTAPFAVPMTLAPDDRVEAIVRYARSAVRTEGKLVIRSNDGEEPERTVRLLPDPLNACEDGEDNDGDGLIDFPDDPGCDHPADIDEFNTPDCVTGTVAACGTGVGACEEGTRNCINNLWGPCEDFTGPEAESCDGLDNDCDRRTDEEITETCQFNGCAGQRACVENATIAGGRWGACAPTTSSPELCDGADNDCNGQVDDGITEVCVVNDCPGSRVCVPGGTGMYTACRADTPRNETCNGMDDDCDGATDEDIPDLTCGVGACTTTAAACVNGMPGQCTAPMGSAEVCNGRDDDCNGTPDDGIADVACGRGACARVVTACVNGVPQTCTPGAASTEICNGLDDDCNGTADDGFGNQTCGMGACARTAPACVNGTPQSCVPGTPGAEVCNGIDDNCNGPVDEGFADLSCGRGVCARTVAACMNGLPQTCTPGIGSAEVCNGLDDDCNGTADDGIVNLTCGRGVCARTVSACLNGSPQTCTPGTASAEVCNGLDDDCNGTADDGLGNLTCGMGACARTVAACVNGAPQTCVAGNSTPEVCNNIDDDCNGTIDDGFGTLSCGMGVCARTVPECVNGVTQTCTPGTGTAEVCNGFDDDCNGPVDDGLGNLSCGQGLCARTVPACINATPQVCTPGIPVAEVCNGADDNCNGSTDEGLADLTCGTGACARTVPACVTGVPQICTPGTGSAEVCNGIDDDCNGPVDDGIVNLTCGVGGCQRTVVACVNGAPQTCTPGMPTAEICNNVDDDCNGPVDEGLGNISCGVGVCARTVAACVDGMSQSCVPGIGSAEICNSMDDDCDTMVDEDIADITCGMGVCARTASGCVNGSPGVCTPGTGSTELCSNGLDEDCDGMIDEPGCQCGLNLVGADPQEPNNTFGTPNPIETPGGVGTFMYEYDVTLVPGDQDWIAFNFPGAGIGSFAEMIVEVGCVGWATTGCGGAGPTVGLDAWYRDDLQSPQLDDSDDGTSGLARVRSSGPVDPFGFFGLQQFRVNVYPTTNVCTGEALQAHLRVTVAFTF